MDHVAAIGQGAPEGVRTLMAGCIESGLCMLDFGSTAPASGAEHYLSHFWEMRLLQERRPSVFHGIAVGIGCVLTSRMYEQVGSLSQQDAARRLSAARLPEREPLLEAIEKVYRAAADHVVRTQAPLLSLTESGFEQLKQRILDRWDQIREIATMMPTLQ